MRLRALRAIPSLFLLCFLWACASVQPPTGGPKDEAAPKLLYSNPRSGAKNFKQQRIELLFNEQIQENNLSEQLLVTPYSGNKFRSVLKKNRLFIDFEKPWPENRTVTLNFRNGIQDVTERNISKDLKLVFATGDVVDSHSVSGKVFWAITNDPAPNLSVGIYEPSDTLNISKNFPLYFSRTDAAGRFRVENVRPGKYHIFAFNDGNNNLTWEDRLENIAFIDSLVTARKDTAISDLVLRASFNDDTPLKISDIGEEKGFAKAYTNKGIEKMTVSSGKLNFYTESIDKENYKILNNHRATDSLKCRVIAVDSMGNRFDSLMTIPFNNKTDTSIKTKRLYSAQPTTSSKLAKNDRVLITFPTGIKKLKTEGFTWWIDSLKTIKAVVNVDSILRQVVVESPQAFTKKACLILPKGFIVNDLDSANAKTDSLNYFPANEEEYGIINVEPMPRKSPFILQLIDENDRVISERYSPQSTVFTQLKPGKYRLRIIEDADNNRRYTHGSLKKNRKPEVVKWYEDKITIKANFEIEAVIF